MMTPISHYTKCGIIFKCGYWIELQDMGWQIQVVQHYMDMKSGANWYLIIRCSCCVKLWPNVTIV